MDGHTNMAGRSNPEDPARQALLANQVLRASRDVRAGRESHAACALANRGCREAHTEWARAGDLGPE
jgi:hypothetical protein